MHKALANILLEFPHTTTPKGRGSMSGFDGEWEKHQQAGSYPHLEALNHSIFAGNRHEDKHGGYIELGRDRAAKTAYLATLQGDRTVRHILANHLVPGYKALRTPEAHHAARHQAFQMFAKSMQPVIDATSDA